MTEEEINKIIDKRFEDREYRLNLLRELLESYEIDLDVFMAYYENNIK